MCFFLKLDSFLRSFVKLAFFVATVAVAWPTSSSFAYEVDNFTGRERLTRDSGTTIDAKVNRILARTVAQANRESRGAWCSRAMLHQEFLRWVGPDPISFLELWATFSDEIEQVRINIDESVYRGVNLKDGPGLWLVGVGRSFKVYGHIIGSDKLGHFFMQGYDYFKQVQDGDSLKHILATSHHEDGLWGLSTSGVYSYADKAANFSGLKFWTRLYGRDKPYIQCEDEKRWVKVRDFTLADYVTDAWDEAINCSEMRPSLASKFERNLSLLGLQCPVDFKKCRDLSSIDQAKSVVSPRCLGDVPLLPGIIANPAAPAPPPQHRNKRL